MARGKKKADKAPRVDQTEQESPEEEVTEVEPSPEELEKLS